MRRRIQAGMRINHEGTTFVLGSTTKASHEDVMNQGYQASWIIFRHVIRLHWMLVGVLAFVFIKAVINIEVRVFWHFQMRKKTPFSDLFSEDK